MKPLSELTSICRHSFHTGLYIALVVVLGVGAVQAQNPLVVTGPDEGLSPLVKIIVNGLDGNDTVSFLAYPGNFTGGVRVATGDVNGDGIADIITAPGAGMGPHVRIFDGDRGRRMRGNMGNFLAYGGNFQGGVFVAAGDVNGDGRADIITGPGAGAPPLVRVFDGLTGKTLHSFLAYDASFTGGVTVAAGDVNGDGFADIITGAGPGGGPHVKVFSPIGRGGPTQLYSFFAFDPTFPGGVYVAAGDVNGDGLADIVVGAGAGGGPHVKVFNAQNNLEVLHSFFAFSANFTGGVRVAAGDVNGDGLADIITGTGPGGGAEVKVFSPITNQGLLHDFIAYDTDFSGGVFVGGFSVPLGR